MRACGLIVEYNPFHNGHVYHIQKAKEISDADCIIAVMSGSFLQRGEPAIIDKFHRTKAALEAGVDIVVELPYVYAVQSSDMFAKGSVHTLHRIGVSSICFGSESGDITHFTEGYRRFSHHKATYHETLKVNLARGLPFPEASREAYAKIGLTTTAIDLSQPNNILGFSYVKTILENKLPIDPLTITRSKSGYHDQTISEDIASATSIRKALFRDAAISAKTAKTLPDVTTKQLRAYLDKAAIWHRWENYFPLVHYRVMTMSLDELANIHGVDEGLEYRIKKTAIEAISFEDWVKQIKTKRYTWTRLQRIFVHILTNTTKKEIAEIKEKDTVSYVRLLGMTSKGKTFLNRQKKEMNIPLLSGLSGNNDPILTIEEQAANAYYSILPPERRIALRHQELAPPIIVE